MMKMSAPHQQPATLKQNLFCPSRVFSECFLSLLDHTLCVLISSYSMCIWLASPTWLMKWVSTLLVFIDWMQL